MKKLILLSALIFTVCTASAQWESQYPLPTGNTLEDVCFIDDLNGWAVGENGTIIHTSDGGESWDFQNSGTELRLRSVVFTDLQTGWVVGGEIYNPGDYIILHTTDGGINWIEQDSDSTTCLRDVFFFDSENGWAVGDHNYILHTNDGGYNWTLQQSGSGYPYCHEVFFTDLMNGWVASSSGLFKTTDGGLNWDVHIQDNFQSIFFIDQNEGWASTFGFLYKSGTILHTTDAFNTWDTIIQCGSSEYSSCGFNSIYFKDTDNGWMLSYNCYSGGWGPGGCSNSLRKTTDGGISWEYIDLLTSLGLNSLYFTQEGKGCIVGDHGIVLNTIDWSDEWAQTSQGNGGVFFSIAFSNYSNGWAVGGEGYNYYFRMGYGSAIVHTSDGGLTWDEQNSSISGPLKSVNFIDEYNGWAVGHSITHNSYDTAFIIHTTNGGEEWLIQKSDTSYYLASIYFTNDSYGWVVGGSFYGDSEGRILKTSDGGTNWEEQYCNTCSTLNAVYFTDTEHGWVAGNLGAIYNTTDGGQTWMQQSYDTTGYSFESLYFTDTQEGWIVGNKYTEGGIILHTLDGGNTWLSELFINTYLYSVHFTDKDNGLISGSNGMILLTRDGGATWEIQESVTDNMLYSVFYTNDGQGWAAGSWATIVHWDTLTVAVEEFEVKNSKSKVWSYPNPFANSTTIEYELEQSSTVQISIYNHLGEQVEVIKKNQAEGKQQVVWDAERLPSGVYYVVLKTENDIHSTKLIKF